MDDPHTDDDDGSGDMNSETNYFHISPISPRKALQPVINKYRGLHYINRPLSGDRNFVLITEQVGERLAEVPTDAQRRSFERRQRVWQAERGLEAIYLDCGWDVKAVEQTNFRRDEFVQKRREHVRNVVEPLQRDGGN